MLKQSIIIINFFINNMQVEETTIYRTCTISMVAIDLVYVLHYKRINNE